MTDTDKSIPHDDWADCWVVPTRFGRAAGTDRWAVLRRAGDSVERLNKIMTDTEMRLYRSWHDRALKAEKALEFYARHIHWMQLTENADVSTVLVAQGDVDSMNGWTVAEAALADTKP